MSREIKFRAWDTENKVFREIEEIILGRNGLPTAIRSNGVVYQIQNNGQISLIQYTGLKDKNGKEIYEGDIIGEESVYHFLEREGWQPSSGDWKIIGEKVKNFTGKGDEKYIAGYELRLVEWKESSCGFEPFSDSDENCHHCGGGRKSTDFEVIGNIYENSELLSSTNI